MSNERSNLITSRPPGLVDVLDRILDKGLVVAGDIKVSLANVELLTIQIRLLVCSIDKAEQIGLDWWRYDSNLTARTEATASENRLGRRIAELEAAVERLSPRSAPDAAPSARSARRAPAGPKRRKKRTES
ncbi:MAG: gas vesicle protein [Blastocatellia bacterium AA13]|nr:MAG: gas vesicle protein [Blastocatellia bacterium AA13]